MTQAEGDGRLAIGVIADDFTGASDIAGILAREGARTVQVVGGPNASAMRGYDAVVVSLKTRSMPAAEAVRLSLDACRSLAEAGASQIFFKICSTFDSTPDGNIGPVAAALLEELDAPLAIVCPAMPANGRTVYQGHLFVHDRLLSESGMERHPLTPTTDPDIRRWLARQTSVSVGHLPLAALREGRGAGALACAEPARLVVADAVTEDDLRALGALARDHALVVGGSGIALGLPANFGLSSGGHDAYRDLTVRGPGLVLAGSCSGATLAQVAAHAAGHPALKVGEEAVVAPDRAIDRAVAFLAANRDREPLIHSTDQPEAVAILQASLGAERVASAFEAFFADLARHAVATGTTRLVAAGGETSGAVVTGLGLTLFEIGPEIGPGVPMLRPLAGSPLAIALKSGNFGAPDFFARALAALGQP